MKHHVVNEDSREENNSRQQYPYGYGPFHPYGYGGGLGQGPFHPYGWGQGSGPGAGLFNPYGPGYGQGGPGPGWGLYYPYQWGQQGWGYSPYRPVSYRGLGHSMNTGTYLKGRTPNEWIKYINPLVERALEEKAEGIPDRHLFQEFILSGVLVGMGYKPERAIEMVEEWEKTEKSQLLQQSRV
ncbi:MAG: hypothetical protein H0Z33_13275 [Bacillaceae bacterium]|nr:hypothetical protein [Bacillaceae bacterium]